MKRSKRANRSDPMATPIRVSSSIWRPTLAKVAWRRAMVDSKVLRMVLDVGCGIRKAEPGAVGIDVHPRSAADILWDLDEFPWPLDSDAFDRIYMSHIIEHVRDVTRT